MKCLVTGATGFIGRELCSQLGEQGDVVIAFSHSGATLPDGTATAALDLANTSLDPAALEGVDVVFHLAGIAHQQATQDAYQQLNYAATLDLARAAAAAGVGCFVFLSSVKAMGPAGGLRVRCEQDYNEPQDAYGQSKWQAECELRSLYADSDMTVRIIRPALVYGPQAKGNLQLLSKGVARGLPRPPGEGGRSMIALVDLVGLLCEVARLDGKGVKTWIATDGQCYSTRQVYDLMRAQQGRSTGRAWCPRWGWRLAAAAADIMRSSPESTWNKLFATELYSNEAVCRDLGWQPTLQLADVLSRTPEAVNQ